ncbi:MAG: 30S ribosomal protein S15 [Candidatus Micrarchaeota archaeon]|nr:30S ribosomal protein S15 [Candidatus Micrarchaeota archaeon]
MARMHSKKHGKAKSRKPVREGLETPEVDRAKTESLIQEMAAKGMQPALIGQRLKDEHKVLYLKHSMGKSLTRIIEGKGSKPQIPYDLMDLMKKAVSINSHLNSNKHDTDNRMRMKRLESKIWRLTKYYIREGKLPSGWRYDPKQAELLIKNTG